MRADAASPRPGGGKHAGCLPYKPLDLFPRPSPLPPVLTSSHGHTSLSSVGARQSSGRSARFRLSGAASTTPAGKATASLSHQTTSRQRSQRSSSSSSSVDLPRAGDAGGFLGSLRATTLLDYGFMREFSLLKRKPLRERDLSRLLAESVYSVRATQLALAQQGRRELSGTRDWQPPPSLLSTHGSDGRSSSKGTDEPRPPAAAPSSHPPARPVASSVARPRQPTPPPYAPREPLARDVVVASRAEFTRSRQPLEPAPQPPLQRSSTRPQREDRPVESSGAAKSAPSLPAVLLWRDLSAFDLRKCHSAAVIAELHGHLQEQDVAALSAATGYNRTELFGLWARFKALCAIAQSPRGIDKDTFRRGLPQLALEDAFFVDRVFDMLDADGSGILEWPEFVEALSALEKGDADTRVRFLFRVYDLSGDGAVHRADIQRFFLASLLIPPTDDVVAVAAHVADNIFSAVGRHGSDSIRVQDALEYMRDHPGDADIYKLLGRTMVTSGRLVVDKSPPGRA